MRKNDLVFILLIVILSIIVAIPLGRACHQDMLDFTILINECESDGGIVVKSSTGPNVCVPLIK